MSLFYNETNRFETGSLPLSTVQPAVFVLPHLLLFQLFFFCIIRFVFTCG